MHQITATCDLCGKEFPFSNGRYHGQRLPHYEMILCSSCHAGNHDGFAPHREAAFEAHLARHGIELPARNAKGLYPRDPAKGMI